MIAYQTAFLKTYYKEDFIAATMSTELNSTSKLREFVFRELKRLKIEVVRPCINNCFAEFKADKNKIFYALSAIKNVDSLKLYQILLKKKTAGLIQLLILIKR